MSKVIDAVVGRIKEKTAIARLYRKNTQMRHGLPADEEDLEIPTVQVEHKHVHEHTGLEKEREVVEGLNTSVKEETKAVEGLTEAVKADKAKPVEVPVIVEKEVVVEKDRDPRKEDGRKEETTSKPVMADWVKKLLLASSLVGGGVGLTMLTNYFTSDSNEASSMDGSLFQYLEDKGEHLPGGFEE